MKLGFLDIKVPRLCRIWRDSKTKLFLNVQKFTFFWNDEHEDFKMRGFHDVKLPRKSESQYLKTKGFFRVQKLLAVWNSDHAALTLPKICFLPNFSEYPLSPPKANGFTISWKEKIYSWKTWSYKSGSYHLLSNWGPPFKTLQRCPKK